MTWRATKLRTKDGQFLIIPNSVIAKEPVLNHSEPTAPTRLEVEVGASYLSPPNEVKRAILGAIDNAPLALKVPAPQAAVTDFGASAITYTALFWIEDYVDGPGRPRPGAHQHLVRLPPAQHRDSVADPGPLPPRRAARAHPTLDVELAESRLGSVDIFNTLTPEMRRSLAVAAQDHLFAAGEAIVQQDAPGDSMFVVLSGRARVVLEPSGKEVAVIPAGGFFGEMSMLTGDPRGASVRALDDARVLEISAATFRTLIVADPELLPHISDVVSSRRAGLEEAKASAAATQVDQPRETLLSRIQRFLRV